MRLVLKERQFATSVEEFRSQLNESLRMHTAEVATYVHYALHDIIERVEDELLPVEDAKIRATFRELTDPWYQFLQGFLIGLKRGLRPIVKDMTGRFTTRMIINAWFSVRYRVAFVYKGYMLQALYDSKLFKAIYENYPDVIKSIYEAARYANRYVRLVEGAESHSIAAAHELYSCMRPKRCHQSMLAIKITPITFKVARDKEGHVYIATFMDNKTLWYNPYSMKTIRPQAWFWVVNRRKSRGEEFSIKHYAGTTVMKLDSEVAVEVDELLQPRVMRKIRDVVFMPHVITKHKARSIGRPEARFDIKHCSVYFIPERKSRARKRSELPRGKLLYELINKVFRPRLA